MAGIRTALTDLLGIEAPIVQAPIGPCAGPELAAPVSGAGGLGMLSVTWQAVELIDRHVARTRELTDRPFGVNVILEWDQHARVEACLAAGVGVVSLFWGDPEPYVDAVHQAGAIVMHTVATPEEARRAVGAGVDVIVAQGVEAGGHVWGETATLPLVPAVVDAAGPVPVVAAGGIADGRGLAAALVLGAAGAWMGTRFLASEEAFAHVEYKRAVVDAVPQDTVLATLFDAEWPNANHRVLRTEVVREWETGGRTANGRSAMLPTPDVTGDLSGLAFYAGQSAGLVGEVLPAGEIVRRTVEEAREVLRRLAANI